MTRRMGSTRSIANRVVEQLAFRSWSLVANEVGSLLKQVGRHAEASHGTVVWPTLVIAGRANPQGLVDFSLSVDVAERGEVVQLGVGDAHMVRLDRLEREHRDQQLQLEQAYRTAEELQRRVREVLPHLQRSALLGVGSPETARRAVAVLNGEAHQWNDQVDEPAAEKNPRA